MPGPAPLLSAEGSITLVTTGSLTVTLPTHAAGDILACTVLFWGPNTAGDAAVIPTPAGWNNHGSVKIGQPAASPRDGWIAYFDLTASSSSETNPVFTRGASWDTGADTAFAGRAYTISGTSGFPAINTAGPYTTASQPFPAIPVGGSNVTGRLNIVFVGNMENVGPGAAPSGWLAGTVGASASGTGARFQTYRRVTSVDTPADTSNTAAPAQGAYGFFGISWIPQPAPSFLVPGRTARNTLVRM